MPAGVPDRMAGLTCRVVAPSITSVPPRFGSGACALPTAGSAAAPIAVSTLRRPIVFFMFGAPCFGADAAMASGAGKRGHQFTDPPAVDPPAVGDADQAPGTGFVGRRGRHLGA